MVPTPADASPAPLPGRAAAGVAALIGAAAVALGAYAAHAAEPVDAQRLSHAALYMMFHALAVLALLGRCGAVLVWVRWILLLAVTLFSGSLIGAALFDLPTRLAPVGGFGLMLGWALCVVALGRGEGRTA
ncbi:DUF423 domain-containing protein [Pseudomarimonas salicorniae]|uniref:DUF423 domain-containing protein n=1 Tax=Pseudomarimonas salicorniae TaxID=2933270 RepID=A0ABT0GLK3_9GAMM|nr:DUF423 domain-containing protein [Lysobacter sp. CAU 1642]MCK7594927.1 DUF423 domain-containing protein [Lysobacter sp. CAU 1642]